MQVAGPNSKEAAPGGNDAFEQVANWGRNIGHNAFEGSLGVRRELEETGLSLESRVRVGAGA